ncbi:MAG: hypothetical protein Unbinned5079contig1000_9 [Prokaryotic dsDNA virus sp.]|nr:MAG: hypothetical protein Unbinned5079contig1000_9 [Prokaryotic dsDNA virus sp.]|tara:strand:+ start:6186 stop:6443 length:258 start_codon:yes stop_codon:yes gene_type:complete
MIVSLASEKNQRHLEARELAEGYYLALISAGWGLYRIGKEHNIEPIYPKGKGILPDCTVSVGIWTEEYLIDQLSDYILYGEKYLI